MAWLESHGNLARHPKTRRLMQRMGWTLPFTIGNLHLLWYWALEYAPTGDLTRFEPEQITYDLDLGDISPAEFLEAMICAGFIDRSEGAASESRSGGTTPCIRLHDWPDYTSRYLRSSKFRRKPEKWLQVCELYSLPAPIPRPARARQNSSPVVPPRRDAPEQSIPSHASRTDQMVDHEPQSAIPIDSDENGALATVQTIPTSASGEPKLAVPPRREEQNPNQAVPPSREPEATQIAVPHILAMEPGFAHTWWPKFLAVYKNHGYPFNAYEAAQALGKLAEHPSKAVSILKHSVKTLTAHPERTRPGWNKNPTAPSALTNNTT